MAIELTDDEQVMEIADCIQDTVEYFVTCDKCWGVTDVDGTHADRELFDLGWRMVDSNNRVLLMCPPCATATVPAGEAERP